MAKVPAPDVFKTSIAKGKTSSAAKVVGLLAGVLGGRYDGKIGATEGAEANVLPLIELESVRSVTVQLHQQTGAPMDPIGLQPQPDVLKPQRLFVFDSATEGTPEISRVTFPLRDVEAFTPGGLSFDPAPVDGADGDSRIRISTNLADEIYDVFDKASEYTHVRLEWDGGNTWRRFAIVDRQLNGGGPFGDTVHLFTDTLPESAGAAPFPAIGEDVTLVIEHLHDAPAPGHMRFNGDRSRIIVSDAPNDLLGPFVPSDSVGDATRVKLEWPGGSAIYDGVSNVFDESGLVHMDIVSDPLSTTGAPLVDGMAVALTPFTPQPDLELYPNAAARARVHVRAGQSGEYTFECDWVGGFQVNAQSIEIDRVSFRPSHVIPYRDATVKLHVSASLDGDVQHFPPQYTEPVEELAPSVSRLITIPQFARRVSLLAKWGDGVSGDAPLAQLFVAFALPYSGSQGFIDALSARAALFGDGLAIPQGAYAIALTNRSGETVQLGAIFHLGL